MSLTITIPAPYFPPVRKRKTGKLQEVNPWINANVREHRHQVAKKTAAWRKAAVKAANGIPAFTEPVHITAHIHKKRAGIYDPNNLNMTTKAIVDGLVEAGVLAEDDYHHVIGPDHRHGGKGEPRIVFTIQKIKEGGKH